jgi:hypothetical protein
VVTQGGDAEEKGWGKKAVKKGGSGGVAGQVAESGVGL